MDVWDIVNFDRKKFKIFINSILIDSFTSKEYLFFHSSNYKAVELFKNIPPCKQIANDIINRNEKLVSYEKTLNINDDT